MGAWRKFSQPLYTPAYAGKIASSVQDIARRDGTPPRMQGKIPAVLIFYGTGNTPAYAGKTLTSHYACSPLPGTPPRMRGKPHHEDRRGLALRNTPAYAGKTDVGNAVDAGLIGTPPRMRGKHFTNSTFTGRNPVLASLRATNPTLQHARLASQTRFHKDIAHGRMGMRNFA